jgi:membrane protein required for colicin V production
MDAIKNLPVNVVDIGVLLILLVSAVLAYARGFVHEVLSVGGWIGAIFATFYGFPYAKPIARQYISFDLAADLAAGTFIFIVTLVFLSLITRAAAKSVQNSALNVLDRSLGFLFGLARGAVLVCVAYIGLELIMPAEDQPSIVREARTLQLIKPGAALLKQLVPDHITSQSTGGGKSSIDVKGLLTPKPKQQDVPAQEGYNKDQRKNLERLIDGTGSNQ